MNDALRKLADAAGIERSYWDALGTHRELDDETATAVLGAMGIAVDGNAGEGMATADVRDSMPAAWIVGAGHEDGVGPTVEVPVPSNPVAGVLNWELELESGEVIAGEIAALTHVSAEAQSPFAIRPIDFGIRLALGYHRLYFNHRSSTVTLIVAPARCYVPEDLQSGTRCWGVSIQLYALRSARNWGIGDFTDLAALASIAGNAGADVIGLNPLHARHLADPDAASPYWPSSRLFLDVLYIDVEAVDDFGASAEAKAAVWEPAFQDRLRRLRAEPLVDYGAITAMKLRVLRMLHQQFRDRAPQSRREAFAAFLRDNGASLRRFAEFEVLRIVRRAADGAAVSWQHWAPEWRDSGSDDFKRFRADAADDIELHMYMQWQAAIQLEAAAAAARNAGLALALYRDLAVGAAGDSAEAWGDQSLIAGGVSIGAPPDLFSRDGQNWGLPPFNPRALAARGYRPFGDLIASNMRGAGALRIDHVMALLRLFWIPSGMSGTRGCYVRSDFDALAAIVALESTRNRCMVIGEDLGSVPDGLRDKLRDRGFLSYRVLIFERWWEGDGSFKRPRDYPAQALAMVATHDMPTVADYWRGGDIERRFRLGLYAQTRFRDEESMRRDEERRRILELLRELGLAPHDESDTQQIAEALHAVIAQTPSILAVVQLDDIVGEVDPTNIPGTTSEYPNWRRKVSVPIEELADDDRLRRVSAIMREAGRG